jgi:uncharacterized protein YbaR (Trm112 family)
MALLRCPRTRQSLRAATEGECAKAGSAPGLTTLDGRWFYPEVQGLPMLRPEDARALHPEAAESKA